MQNSVDVKRVFARPPRARKQTINRTGRVASALICAICLWSAACQAAVPEALAFNIASDPTIRGKGEDGECLTYASALSSRLAANGIHGRLIFYRWHLKGSALTGSHVLVYYQLPDQTAWVVDNEKPVPREVPTSATPLQLIYLLSNTDASSAPVDIELQEGLNRLSFF
jgi:hypothetical protein